MTETFESIVTAEVHHQHRTAEVMASVRARAAKQGIIWLGPIEVAMDHKHLRARIEEGRAIVDCPECLGAEFLDESRMFMCQVCFNGKAGKKYIPVDVPKDWSAIQEVLLERPIRNRNWRHGEKLSDLKKENRLHGLDLSKDGE